jgi:predicted GNAT family N-acyltransferase
MTSSADIRTVLFGSPEQLESIELRRDVLRKPLGLDFSAADLAKEKDQVHIVARIENEIAGVLLLKNETGDEKGVLRMRQVAVKPDWQGKGIGRQMVLFSELWASSNGCHKIVLHARENAVKFYTGLGYTKEGEPFEEVGIPHEFMYKNL